MPRLGLVVVGVAAMTVSIMSIPPAGDIPWYAFVLVAALAITGAGLVLRNIAARVVAGLGLCALLGYAPYAVYTTWRHVDVEWDPAVALLIANAAATTIVGGWFAVRAVAVVLGRARPQAVTARLVGGALVVIAASHLYVARSYDWSASNGFAISISSSGTQFVAFGWPLVHAVLLCSGLTLAIAPPRARVVAATVVMIVAVTIVPLVVVSGIASGMPVAFMIPTIALTVVVAFLGWWLRDEVVAL